MDEQRLVPRGMPGRGNQDDASIAEYVAVTVDELEVLGRAQELARQSHQLIYVVVRPVRGIYPLVLGLLHQDCRVGEDGHVTYVVSMRVRYCNTSDVARIQSDFGELICQRPVEVVDDQFG